jgi:hypothetical protein
MNDWIIVGIAVGLFVGVVAAILILARVAKKYELPTDECASTTGCEHCHSVSSCAAAKMRKREAQAPSQDQSSRNSE